MENDDEDAGAEDDEIQKKKAEVYSEVTNPMVEALERGARAVKVHNERKRQEADRQTDRQTDR